MIGIEQTQKPGRRAGSARKPGTTWRPIATGSACFRSATLSTAITRTATLRTAAETPRHGRAGRVELFARERIVVVRIEPFQQPAEHLASRLRNLIKGNATILIGVQLTQAIEWGAIWAWAPFRAWWPAIA